MSVRVDFNDEGKFIFVKFHGRTTYRDLNVAAEQASELAKAHDWYDFLIDLSQMNSVVATFEICDLPRLYKSLGIPYSARLAVVAPAILTKDKEDARFYETVCRNSGFTIETFDGIESARKWLARERGAT